MEQAVTTTQDVIQGLRAIPRLAGKVSTEITEREGHGRDDRFGEDTTPLAVVSATDVDDVRAVVDWARETGTAIIPYGVGTAEEGFLVATRPSVSLDLSGMDQVIEVRTGDFQAVVQPGIRREQLNEQLKPTGLFFPVDPGSNSSIGGMASTNASGTATVGYGGMHRNVIAMKVVTADGRLLTLGRPVRKSSSAYDLKDLFIGASGTLGVIVELTLELYPIPQHTSVVRAFFPTMSDAAAAAYSVIAARLPVERLEGLDANGIEAVNLANGTGFPVLPALWIGLSSAAADARASDISHVEAICARHGGIGVESASDPREVEEMWEIRHRLYGAAKRYYPDRKFKLSDTAVPLSRLVEMVDFSKDEAARLGIDVMPAGHIGDGNVHVLAALKPGQEEIGQQYADALVRKSLELDGTATGEHGVGLAKRRYMRAEHGDAVDVMWAIKRALDPLNIMNPGKVLPD